jgi:hypothetical protein
MDGAGNHHVKQKKMDSERRIYVFSNMWNPDLKTTQSKNKDKNVKGEPLGGQ